MNKKNIYFKADEQLLTNITPNCFASDTVAYIEAHFDLGENWSGFDSVRAVWTNGAAVISSVLYDGACIVPWEVLTKRAEVKVNLVGSNVENDELIDRLTTCQVPALNIKCKALIEGSNTATPTPSEYEQFVQNVHEDADRAEAARDEAEQILTDTEQIKTDVENLKTQTLAIKVETESIKGDVETLKSQTEDLVDGFGDEVEEALDRISAKEDDVLYDIDSAKTSALGEINNKQTIALAEIVNAKSSALTDISSARVTSLTEIQTEGTTQKNLVTAEGTTQIQAIEDKGAEVIASIPLLAPVITDTATGDIVSFTDGADDYPIKSLKVSLEPKQSGTGDPSPSNIRPISGWDEVNVEQCGKNLVSNYGSNLPYNALGVVVTGEGGEYNVVVNNATGYPFARLCTFKGLKRGTYTSTHNGIGGLRLIDRQSNPINIIADIINTRKKIVITEDITDDIYLELTLTASALTNGTYPVYAQFEVGEVGTSFEPYHGQSHSISFPSTVYGGEVSVIDGDSSDGMYNLVLTGLENWVESSSYYEYNVSSSSTSLPYARNITKGSGHCSHFIFGTTPSGGDGIFCGTSTQSGKYIIFLKSRINTLLGISSLTEFKTYLRTQNANGTPVQVVYWLKDFVPFTTTPEQISTYKGANTIWSDGAVECEYCADTKLYINKLING